MQRHAQKELIPVKLHKRPRFCLQGHGYIQVCTHLGR